MRKAFFSAFAATVFLTTLSSCGELGAYAFLFGEEDVEERYSSFTDESCPALSEASLSAQGITAYSGLIITDSHFGSGEARHEDAFYEWLGAFYDTAEEAKKPRFLINLGDTADFGAKDQYEAFNTFAANVRKIAQEKLGLASAEEFPVYSVLGNHDLYDRNGWKNFKELLAPHSSSYYFTVGTFRFYGVDTGGGSMGGAQLSDFERLLRADAAPKVVFSHYPIYAGGVLVFAIHDTYERNRIIAACAENNVRHLFEGHQHEPRDFDFGPLEEHIVGSFLYKRRVGLLTLDERTESITHTRIEY